MSVIVLVWLALGLAASGNWERLREVERPPLCREVITRVHYREIGDGHAIVLPQILEWPCEIPIELVLETLRAKEREGVLP